MSRPILSFAFIILISLAVFASAADKKTGPAPAPATAKAPNPAAPGGAAASPPVDGNTIGTTDGQNSTSGPAPSPDGEVAVAGPVGSDSTYSNYPPEDSPSGASALGISSGSFFLLYLWFIIS